MLTSAFGRQRPPSDSYDCVSISQPLYSRSGMFASVHFSFGPRGSMVSGRQGSSSIAGRSGHTRVFACSQSTRVGYPLRDTQARGIIFFAMGEVHNTDTHSALAVAAEVSRENATSSH